ncbi:MAG: hypothetical protein LBD37_03975 [Treponema sp.]|jgi:hypothetical protein|nr:hypothetical protein [Treponema sp.]
MTVFLLEYLPRPLSLKEYRLLAGFNKEVSYYPGQEEGLDKKYGDPLGYNALILEDVKKGLLDPLEQDDRGTDLFDWAAETGTAGLMEGLMPALKKSGRVILGPEGAGLFASAVKAENHKTAALRYAEAPHKFIAQDRGGNNYSLEYYFCEYGAIRRRAKKIDRAVLKLQFQNSFRLKTRFHKVLD